MGDYTATEILDPASNESTNGTITLVLDKSALGLQTGDQLTNILSSTRTSTPDGVTDTVTADGGQVQDQLGVPGGVGLTQDEGGAAIPYTLIGNATCDDNAAPVANLTANVQSGRAPLDVDFDGSGSTAQSGQATVAYYRFDFGDGASTPWQTASTAEHVYQSSGTYVATLEVADNRGLISTSDSSVAIAVQAHHHH